MDPVEPFEQLRLLPAENPMTRRHGREFFLGLPRAAGVYRMFDGRGRLLYVGKTCNLRRRLSSYRYIHPDRHSGRLVRLVHETARIEVELARDGSDALCREGRSLRLENPKLNRMNRYIRLAPFIGLARVDLTVRLFLRRHCSNPEEAPARADDFWSGEAGHLGIRWFGAFKGHSGRAFQALARTAWRCGRPGRVWSDFPRSMTCAKAPNEIQIHFATGELAEAWHGRILEFLAGTKSLGQETSEAGLDFDSQWQKSDAEWLERFFERGPRLNRLFCEENRFASSWISPEVIYDLLCHRE